MNIHFVGIGGIGISALAQFCFKRGDHVSGSNLGSNRIFEMLINEGITSIYDVHDAHNLAPDLELLIYSEAIPPHNPERQEAKKRGIKEKSYFEFLGDISHEFTTIAVAGTHGKTTTTGLIAAGLKQCEFDATVFVGSTLDILEGKNFHMGSNHFLVLEACEYRENFKFLKPEVLLITNIEWDHADYFKTEQQYFDAFKALAKRSKNVLFHQNDEVARAILQDVNTHKIPIPEQSQNSWEYILKIFGNANQKNATLALSIAHFLKIDTETFKQGLGTYKGASRRQEFLGEKRIYFNPDLNLREVKATQEKAQIEKNVLLYDDYGHHPTEIKVTLEAFRDAFPNKQIGLIFEPHQYSRAKQFFQEFIEALNQADFVGLYPIYEARDSESDKASISLDDFIAQNPSFKKIESTEDVMCFCENLKNDDLLLFMGAGKISEFAHKFLTE